MNAMAKRELIADQLIVFGHPGPLWPLLVGLLIVLGLLTGVVLQLSDSDTLSPWSFPKFIILIGVIALLRRVHVVDRRAKTVTSFLGLLLPVRRVLRLPVPIATRSFKGSYVSVRAKTKKYAATEMGPGGEQTVYRVGIGYDRPIWLATFNSSLDARSKANEITAFLQSATTRFHR